MEKELHERIQKLQSIEENLHRYLAQKQQLQSSIMEMESAQDALSTAKKSYKIIGNIMVEQSKEEITSSLKDRMERTQLRMTALEKQEAKLKEKAEAIQKEVMGSMKK